MDTAFDAANKQLIISELKSAMEELTKKLEDSTAKNAKFEAELDRKDQDLRECNENINLLASQLEAKLINKDNEADRRIRELEGQCERMQHAAVE